jgi:adenosine deaminase
MRACIENGVFRSVDLYGLELARDADVFTDIYRYAKQHGLKLKAHAGEFGTAESVRHTVEVLELDEVQHGIAAAASPEVMDWLCDNGIRLNVCPTSNVRLGIVKTLREHPIRTLFDAGVSVTINTDDLMIFDQSVSEEYANLFREGVFTAAELDDIRTHALSPKTH